MKKKYIFLIAIIFFLTLTTIHAESNDTTISVSDESEINKAPLAISEDTQELSQSYEETKLEQSYFYDADDDEYYDDDTVITNNVVKYYGDTSKKFKIKVLDDNYDEIEGVYVSFGRDWDSLKEKQTNSYGNVYFPINYKVGTHYVMTYIECENDDGTTSDNYFLAENKVTIKTTIPTKTLSKHINEKNKKFKIKFLDTKGKPLKNTKVQIKVKNKVYKVKTNSKGIASIKINAFKVGKHTITAINPKSKEKRKITVTIKKKYVVRTTVVKVKKVKDGELFIKKGKKLPYGKGDAVICFPEYRKSSQYPRGLNIDAWYYGNSNEDISPHHIKLIKAKVYYKSSSGKIKTKIVKSNKYGCYMYAPFMKNYAPYKVKIWYKA
ncbi:hypothetical protein [Methanobrevibacter sp.]|uniref:hypothetical protein n=1 Tax=Methanobrevibacter sp. TaxID=66852 RepID=UPI003870BFBC